MATILCNLTKKYKKKSQESVLVTFFDNIDAFGNVEYPGRQGNTIVGDVYRPKNYSEKLPVIIMLHGGGFFMGDSKLDMLLCQMLAVKGYLVYALDYRLTDEATAVEEMSDACAGYDFVEKTLELYGGDKDRVYVVAESAGAYLSLFTVAMHKNEEYRQKFGLKVSGLDIKKMVCFSGMFYTYRFDIVGWLYPKQIYPGKHKDKEFKKLVNPENDMIVDTIPPTLLTSSRGDFLKRQTLRFNKVLNKKEKEHELIYIKKRQLKHAFPADDPTLPDSIDVINYIADKFFKE